MKGQPTRRDAVAGIAGSLVALANASASEKGEIRLARFSAEVTPPLGHPLMGGGIAPAKEIVDPLFTHGVVFLSDDKPIVIAAVDWCEIRNEGYDRWRDELAEAVGTTRERVLVSCLHQHDAPIADLEAERILKANKATGSICDLEFHEKTVLRVARAAKESLSSPRRVTHIGTGQAKVENVASNRRYLVNAKPAFGRMSATRDPAIRAEPEGTIDPWLKTLSFWDGEQPLVALSHYASHPMSYYGKGGVSSDFVGMARNRRQADDPKTLQIYLTGCSGNVTAGKYNDGSVANRPLLADRIYQGMAAAWKATKRQPLERFNFRKAELRLEPRNSAGFTVADLTKRLQTDAKPFGQCLAALGLSWRKRADAGHKIDVPLIDFGPAQIVLLPGESYVEYQLLSQQLRPNSFVVAIGYGECATGYVPIERAFEESDTNLNDWCWVAPGAEASLTKALTGLLQ